MFILRTILGMIGPFFFIIPIIIYAIFKIRNKKKNEILPEGYSSFEKRVCAFAIDFILIILIDFLLMLIFNALSLESLLPSIFVFVFAVTNQIILPSKTGWSLGKRVLFIKIIKKDNSKVDFYDMFYRELVKSWFSTSLLFLGCLWMMIGKNKLTWHDSVADTRVVNLSY